MNGEEIDGNVPESEWPEEQRVAASDFFRHMDDRMVESARYAMSVGSVKYTERDLEELRGRVYDNA